MEGAMTPISLYGKNLCRALLYVSLLVTVTAA
jgi:hypothetical protein